MKSTFTTLAAAAAIAAAGAASANTVITTGTFTTYTNWSRDMGQHYFSTSGGQTTINIFECGFGGNCGDSYIYLFSDDGNLTSDDFIAENDDNWGGAGWNSDGSTSGLDSFLSLSLAAGNYLLMVGECCSGFNWDQANVLAGNQYATPNGSIYNVYDYQVTLSGNDVAFTAPAPVPLPASLPLLGSAIIAAGALARRKRKSA